MGKRDIVRSGPLQELIKEAEALGCELIRNSRSGHPKLLAPNGRKFVLSCTPRRGGRAVTNESANLRRWLRQQVLAG